MDILHKMPVTHTKLVLQSAITSDMITTTIQKYLPLFDTYTMAINTHFFSCTKFYVQAKIYKILTVMFII
jgi:hypothetical protein